MQYIEVLFETCPITHFRRINKGKYESIFKVLIYLLKYIYYFHFMRFFMLLNYELDSSDFLIHFIVSVKYM